jgi:hypothetical protein
VRCIKQVEVPIRNLDGDRGYDRASDPVADNGDDTVLGSAWRPWDCAAETSWRRKPGLIADGPAVLGSPPFDLYRCQVDRWIGRLAEHGRGTALLHARCETAWFGICWQRATAILFMAKRLIFVKPVGTPCTTRSGERANSGEPPVLVAFGDYDAMRLRRFASEYGGALVERWQLFGSASLLEAAE